MKTILTHVAAFALGIGGTIAAQAISKKYASKPASVESK